jgi:hypothetical protein
MRYPSEAQIEQVMKETGMQYIQARNHLIGRFLIQDKLARGGLQHDRRKAQQ